MTVMPSLTGHHPSRRNQWLLPSLVDHRARHDGDVIWTEYPASPHSYGAGFKSVNYRQLANAVNGAAHWLERTLGGRSTTFETLAYVGPNDIRYMVLVLAAIKAGYKPPAISQLVSECKLPLFIVPSVDELLSTDHPYYLYDKTFDEAKDEPFVALHTSGSTGLPKPIIYTHDFASAYANLCQHTPPPGFESQNDLFMRNRMFFMLPPFHAGGVLMHLMNAVFNKTTIIIPLATTVPSARGLAEALRHTKADVAFVTPLTCYEFDAEPQVLDDVASRLEYLFYAGGDCPEPIGNLISQKLKLFTIIGYTECGSMPQIRPIGDWPRNDWKAVQISPLAGCSFRHLMDDLYEMWWERKPGLEDIQTPFKLFPELNEYSSRDLFSRHPTKENTWLHRGRADDIIVFLNGEKTNPISYEAAITSSPYVKAALVIGTSRFQAALLIEPEAPLSSSQARADLIERLWPLIEHANQDCPAHAKVVRSHVLFTSAKKPLPRAGKGTVQRPLAVSAYREEIDALYSDADRFDGSAALTSVTEMSYDALLALVREQVKIVNRNKELQDSDDFFARGMDSLAILQLVRGLRLVIRCDDLAPSTVYTNASILTLVAAIRQLGASGEVNHHQARARFEASIEESYGRHEQNLNALLSDRVSHGDLEKVITQTPRRVVLLTGSTGSIASYILEALVQLPSVSHVFCLNRSANSEHIQRERNAARGLAQAYASDRVTYLHGDLAARNFGLSPTNFSTLRSSVTDIIHAAWPVNFSLALGAFEPQLTGISHLAAFSASLTRHARIFFLSSISAIHGLFAPDRQTKSSPPPSVPEGIFDSPSSAGTTGYAASKHIAERLLARASETSGIETHVIRVGQVAGPAHSAGPWDRHEWLPSLVLSSRAIEVLPDSLGAAEDVDWVPVDVLAAVILDLAALGRDSETLARGDRHQSAHVYHPLNPAHTTWTRLLPGVQQALSAPQTGPVAYPEAEAGGIGIVPLADWIRRLKGSGAASLPAADTDGTSDVEDLLRQNPALKLVGFFEELLRQSETVGTDGRVRLETKQAQRASRTLRELRAIDDRLMRRWVHGWIGQRQ